MESPFGSVTLRATSIPRSSISMSAVCPASSLRSKVWESPAAIDRSTGEPTPSTVDCGGAVEAATVVIQIARISRTVMGDLLHDPEPVLADDLRSATRGHAGHADQILLRA